MPLTVGQVGASFVAPALAAAGAAAIAIPILIHLLSRRRRIPVLWGAMRFLLEAYRRHRRRPGQVGFRCPLGRAHPVRGQHGRGSRRRFAAGEAEKEPFVLTRHRVPRKKPPRPLGGASSQSRRGLGL